MIGVSIGNGTSSSLRSMEKKDWKWDMGVGSYFCFLVLVIRPVAQTVSIVGVTILYISLGCNHQINHTYTQKNITRRSGNAE